MSELPPDAPDGADESEDEQPGAESGEAEGCGGAGEPLPERVKTYTYDAIGRLVLAEDPDASRTESAFGPAAAVEDGEREGRDDDEP